MAAGILLSRLSGLIRQRALAHYLGLTGSADAFTAAFRIPNILQNLFGEGALSASFIPAYVRAMEADDTAEARRLAGAVAALLGVTVAVSVLVGVLAAPWLVDLLAPGFAGERRTLTLRLVRILFPGAGLLVLSAWCLGVLNAHRRFFVSYAAPVVWNGAILVALIVLGSTQADGGAAGRTATVAAWGAVVGSVLQVAVQWPQVRRVAGAIPVWRLAWTGRVREVVTNFFPAMLSRGVVQVSAYVDTLLASLLPVGAVAAMMNAQMLYTLPVSLLGISVAASELPEMARGAGNDGGGEALRSRLVDGWRRLLFFVIPTVVAFLLLGGWIAAALFQTGRFTAGDARYVWAILAGASLGLIPSTAGRLWSSGFFALGDTTTPLRYAVRRVLVGVGLGAMLAIFGPGWVGLDARWGVVGLALAGAVAGWVEYGGLRRAMARRLRAAGGEEVPWEWRQMAFLSGMAGLAGGAGAVVGYAAEGGGGGPILTVLAAGIVFSAVYFMGTVLARHDVALAVLRAVRRGRGGRG